MNFRPVPALLAIVLCLFLGCFRDHPDSLPEEAIELIIRETTGFDIDLTSEDGK